MISFTDSRLKEISSKFRRNIDDLSVLHRYFNDFMAKALKILRTPWQKNGVRHVFQQANKPCYYIRCK